MEMTSHADGGVRKKEDIIKNKIPRRIKEDEWGRKKITRSKHESKEDSGDKKSQ